MAAQKTGSTSRKRSTAKSNKKEYKQKKQERQNDSFLKDEISVILLFAFSVVLLISNFKIGGAIGGYIRSIQLGLFGMTGYLFPFLFFFSGVIIISNKGDIRAKIKVSGAVGAMFCSSALLHTVVGKEYVSMESLREFYHTASGGGLVGGALVALFSLLLGKVGAVILLLTILIISVVCLSEKSFVGLIKAGGDRAYRSVKDDIGKRLHERDRDDERGYEAAQYSYIPEDDSEYEDYEDDSEYYESFEDMESVGDLPTEEPRRNDLDLSITKLRDNSADTIKVVKKKLDRMRSEIDAGEEYEKSIKEDGFALHTDKEISFPREDADMTQKEKDFFEGIPEIDFTQANNINASSIAKEQEGEAAGGIFTGNIIRSFEDNIPDEKEDVLDEETIRRVNEILEKKRHSGIPEEGVYSGAEDNDFYNTYQVNRNEEESEITLFSIDDEEETYPTNYRGGSFNTESENDSGEGYGDEEDEDAEVIYMGEKAAQEKPLPPPVQNMEKAKLPENPLPHRGQVKRYREYRFPSTELLNKGNAKTATSDLEYRKTAIKLQQTLHNFGVEVDVGNISCGPTVTRYELHPKQGVKVSKIVALADDIKLSLAASDIRIEAPIPGKPAVGIEVPNRENTLVYLRELLESEEYRKNNYKLKFALGRDIGGRVVVADIAKMPHLLIAGATGSGKSVCINTLIMSVIYGYSPKEVKLILIDPKVVELSIYKGIQHLLIPVVTDAKKAATALNWAVAEMTNRYKLFAEAGVRNLFGYNEKMSKNSQPGTFEKMHKIIIIIDELADLMMVAQNEVEDAICRLAQLARACGIHLVIATQRPSVNVITGLIKANIPSRIAFAVSSSVDSRTILDGGGAEKLLGKGDMLFSTQSNPKPVRVQGAFVSDKEVQNVVDFLKNSNDNVVYNEETRAFLEDASENSVSRRESERDELFVQAGKFIIEREKASIGNLQRVFKIGFNRAARIMDQLAEAGVVGEEQGTKPRQVLMNMEEFEAILSD